MTLNASLLLSLLHYDTIMINHSHSAMYQAPFMMHHDTYVVVDRYK